MRETAATVAVLALAIYGADQATSHPGSCLTYVYLSQFHFQSLKFARQTGIRFRTPAHPIDRSTKSVQTTCVSRAEVRQGQAIFRPTDRRNESWPPFTRSTA